MKLVIFDVDGTLTQTYELDQACFIEAFAEAFGLNDVHADWSRYQHTTDSGVTHEIFQTRYGRAPTDAEIARVQHCFIERLKAARSPSPSGAAPGAAAVLKGLQSSPDWHVVIATGCWQVSADQKLAAAGLEVDGIPMICCDAIHARIKILQAAIALASDTYGCNRFEKIIYVGDGIWDLEAARAVQTAFVGVGAGDRAQALQRAGADWLLKDFSDAQAVREALEAAAPHGNTERRDTVSR